MNKNIEAEVSTETVSAQFRIDLTLCIGDAISDKSMYIVISGIPKDLPENMRDTITYVAEARFVEMLNERAFVELYDLGKTKRDSMPRFINASNITWLEIKSVTEVTEAK